MDRKDLVSEFKENHNLFIDYIKSLTDEEFVREIPHKWTAAQQLAHLVLGMETLAQLLSNKAYIESKFGKIDRPNLGYDEIVNNYVTGLKNGAKAPTQYEPDKIKLAQKQALIQALSNYTHALVQSLDKYNEDEFDSLIIPHPFMGNLSIREMIHFMAYHALHHLKSVQKNLEL